MLIQYPGEEARPVTDDELEAIEEKVIRISGEVECPLCGKLYRRHGILKVLEDGGWFKWGVAVMCDGHYGHM